MSTRDELAHKTAIDTGSVPGTYAFHAVVLGFKQGYDAGQTSPEVKAMRSVLARLSLKYDLSITDSDLVDAALADYEHATSGKASECC